MTISNYQIELLYMEGCPNRYPAAKTLESALRQAGLVADINQVLVSSEEEAQTLGFLGSPSIRINGHDVEGNDGSADEYCLQQRLYLTREGFRGYPSKEMVLMALSTLEKAHLPH